MLIPLVISALSGAIFSTTQPPVGLWFLALALLPLFVLLATAERNRQAFALGFWFGLTFFALYLFWLPNSLSEIFGPVAWIIYLPLVLIEAAFWGMVTFLSRWLGKRGTGTLWLLPAFWLIMEWARTQGPLAFPWGSLGYVWLGTPVAQAADLAGSYGLSFLVLLLVALLAALVIAKDMLSRILCAVFVVAFMVVAWGYGLTRLEIIPLAPDRQALLVQGNTDPLGRAQGETDDVTVYTRLTSEAIAGLEPKPDLVIWPEGAVIGEIGSLEAASLENLRFRLQESADAATLITGMSVWERGPEGYLGYNSVYGLADARVTDRYDKVYLVPFGEGIPFVNVFQPLYDVVYGWFSLSAATRLPGQEVKPIVTPDLTAAVYICYESVFPQVARQMVKKGAEVLVNISNDAWFGVGNGAEQHYAMGSMRAIETRRYVLRAGNDGITAVIDPLGKTLERILRFEEATLLADYALSSEQTLYVRYGDWLVYAVMMYGLVAVLVLGSRHHRQKGA